MTLTNVFNNATIKLTNLNGNREDYVLLHVQMVSLKIILQDFVSNNVLIILSQLLNTVLQTALLNLHYRILTFVPLLALIHFSKIQPLSSVFLYVQHLHTSFTK